MTKNYAVETKDFSEVVYFQEGPGVRNWQFTTEGIKLINIKNIVNNELKLDNTSNYLGIEEVENKYQHFLLNEGDYVLASSGASWGKIAEVQRKHLPLCLNTSIIRLVTKDEKILDKRYLWYFIKSQLFIRQIERLITGSAQPNFGPSHLKQIKIKIPNIDRQIKITEVLDISQELIGKRKAQIEALDDLVKSKFIEMFGDPINNPKNFELLTVDDVIEFQGGSQPDKKYFEYKKTDDNIRLIQIRDYKTDVYITYIPKTMAKRFCDADDIMIGRYGPPIFQILKGIEGSYNVALMKATPKIGNKEFIRQFLKQECLFNYLDGLSQRTAGQSGIDMPKLKQYPFPYPPIELQNQFADFLKQIDKLKFEMQKSLEEMENNFSSLMQRAFKGELFNEC